MERLPVPSAWSTDLLFAGRIANPSCEQEDPDRRVPMQFGWRREGGFGRNAFHALGLRCKNTAPKGHGSKACPFGSQYGPCARLPRQSRVAEAFRRLIAAETLVAQQFQ